LVEGVILLTCRRFSQVYNDIWGLQQGNLVSKPEKYDWSREDRVPDLVMNEILWQGIKGKPAPSPVRAAFIKEQPKKDKD
jgi:hypothetical protein